MTAADDLKADLAIANRILVAKGVLDAFGHVSARDPEDPTRFLLARNLAPGNVEAEDVIVYDADGETSDSRPGYLERYIHSEIYRTRPDVGAVVHSHAPDVLPFAVGTVPLRAVTHMAAFLDGNAPVFEIREFAGDASDLLIRDRDLGAALARTLGGSAVALMRGHGSVVVAPTLAHVVQRAVYLAVNARVQLQALALGSVTALTPGEREAARIANDGQVARAWNVWRDEVSTRRPS